MSTYIKIKRFIMDSLNKDCLCSIAYYLNFSDIYNFSKTCRKIMKQVYNNKYFWMSKIHNSQKHTKIGNICEDGLFLQSLETLEVLRKKCYYSQYSRHHAFSKAVLNGDMNFVSQFYSENRPGLIRNNLYQASSRGHLNVVKYLSTDILPAEKSLIKMCMDAAIRNKHSHVVNFYIQRFEIPKANFWYAFINSYFWKNADLIEFLVLFIILIFNFNLCKY